MQKTQTEHKVRDYVFKMSSETSEALYLRLLEEIVVKKRFLDPNLRASTLAKDLDTTLRHISSVMALGFKRNFNAAVNHHRVRHAISLMHNRKYDNVTCEQIGIFSGFTSRQSFYNAFNKEMGETPLAYRKRYLK